MPIRTDAHAASWLWHMQTLSKTVLSCISKATNFVAEFLFDYILQIFVILLFIFFFKFRIPVHRVVLNAASKYFADLLGPDIFEEKANKSVCNDSDGETIKSLVNFCYTGNVELTENNAEKILQFASAIESDLLINELRQYYSTKLCVAHSVSILMMADKYGFDDLRKQAFQLICKKFEMVPSVDFQKLSHSLLQELLNCDEIQKSGNLFATRLLEWFQCDEDERDVYMPELLKLIQLEQLKIEVRFKYTLL